MLTSEEIRALTEERVWGTLIAVEGDRPYGVELAYTFDGEYVYFSLSRPNGRIIRCLRTNPNIALKICEADAKPKTWRAAIIEGKAEKVTQREEIFRALRSLAKRLELVEDYYNGIAERFAHDPESSTLYRLAIKEVGGKYKTEEIKYRSFK